MIIRYLNILNEGAVDDKIKRYIREYISSDDKPFLDIKMVDLPEDLKNNIQSVHGTLYNSCVQNNLRFLDYCRLYLLKFFDISHNKGPVEYSVGIARIACSELGLFNERRNNSKLLLFKQLILFMHNNQTALPTVYDKNLNGKTFKELKDEINNIRKGFNQKRRELLKNIPKRTTNVYKIKPITNKEESYKFAKYTDWCITRDDYFDNYTKDGSRFYFCLRNGFENVKREKTEGCPLDEYGLSLIAVLVDTEGEPVSITTRWNHENDGENNENFKTPEQFEELTGISFYDTFKPYTSKELKEMGIVTFEELEDRLDNGENPLDVFSFCETIYLNSIDNNILLVKANDKYNFVNIKTNKLLSDIWFSEISTSSNDYKIMNRDNLPPIIAVWHNYYGYNYFDLKEEHLISDNWYNDAMPYFNKFGISIVCKSASEDKNIFALINTKGEAVSDWYDKLDYVKYSNDEILFRVKKNDKWYIINATGKIISTEFDDIKPFFEYKNEKREYKGAVVERNGKYNIIDDNIKFLSDKWYNSYEYIDKHEDGKLYKISEEKLEKFKFRIYAIALINSIENKDFVLI